MSVWLWIALPLLFLLGVFINAIKGSQQLEKTLPQYRDKIRPVEEDEDEAAWRKAREQYHEKTDKDKNTNKIK